MTRSKSEPLVDFALIYTDTERRRRSAQVKVVSEVTVPAVMMLEVKGVPGLLGFMSSASTWCKTSQGKPSG